MDSIPWPRLRLLAHQSAQRAYAPYSGLHVGAAGIDEFGMEVTGCNVENASYGLTLCAECGLVSDLHRRGGGRLVAVTMVDGHGNHLSPCGRCRQLLREHGSGETLIDGDRAPRRLEELLPDAFLAGAIAPRLGVTEPPEVGEVAR